MKKSIFILLLLAVTVTIQAQATIGDFAAHKVSLTLDAYEHSNGVSNSGEYRTHTLVVDDFYDIHIIKTKFNRMVNEYSDVNYTQSWKWDPDYEYFLCNIDFIDLHMMIAYSEISQTCIVLYDRRKGEKEL